MESVLEHRVSSGLRNEECKPISSNKAGNLLPAKEVVSSAFVGGQSINGWNCISQNSPFFFSQDLLETRKDKEIYGERRE